MSLAAIFLATFASEDLTCLAVGLLVHAGQLDPFVGLAGCGLGIFIGDVGLWLLGRLLGLGLLRPGSTGACGRVLEMAIRLFVGQAVYGVGDAAVGISISRLRIFPVGPLGMSSTIQRWRGYL